MCWRKANAQCPKCLLQISKIDIHYERIENREQTLDLYCHRMSTEVAVAAVIVLPGVTIRHTHELPLRGRGLQVVALGGLSADSALQDPGEATAPPPALHRRTAAVGRRRSRETRAHPHLHGSGAERRQPARNFSAPQQSKSYRPTASRLQEGELAEAAGSRGGSLRGDVACVNGCLRAEESCRRPAQHWRRRTDLIGPAGPRLLYRAV